MLLAKSLLNSVKVSSLKIFSKTYLALLRSSILVFSSKWNFSKKKISMKLAFIFKLMSLEMHRERKRHYMSVELMMNLLIIITVIIWRLLAFWRNTPWFYLWRLPLINYCLLWSFEKMFWNTYLNWKIWPQNGLREMISFSVQSSETEEFKNNKSCRNLCEGFDSRRFGYGKES